MLKVLGQGPARANVVVVGEAPGLSEELAGKPFVGPSGQLLDRLLREAGMRRSDIYVTNVCKYMPPGGNIETWITDKKRAAIASGWNFRDGRYMHPLVEEGLGELFEEVFARRPKIVVGFGNVALWAFAHEWGITNWRGSELAIPYRADATTCECLFVPTLHPVAVLRQWELRTLVEHDLKMRVARRLRAPVEQPEWDFNIAPTLHEVSLFLGRASAQGCAAVDVETSRGQIVCVGIALSPTQAMCIPFIHENYGAYWSVSDARDVVARLADTLPHIAIVGQNFNYDASYFLENFGLRLQAGHDTKIAQNVLWPGMPANLGFLSSMYCDWHRYWKEDARDWANLRDFDGLFTYNCRDTCATFEIAQAQKRALAAHKLEEQFADRMRYNAHVFDMQTRGLLRSPERVAALEGEIEEKLAACAHIVGDAAGREINIASPLQVSKVLYDDLKCRKPAYSAGGSDDAALEQVAKWHPEHARLCEAVMEWRSLAAVRSNFLRAQCDPDGRLRSSFLATGAETFRLTSSKNNFGRGCNLLNISAGKRAEGGINYRRVIVPPPGYTMFDCDLQRADLQVVVWEADDEDLKAKLREGVDIHTENAKDIFGSTITVAQREMGKTFVHLTNYGGKARTCAIAVGTTVHEAEMAQRRWFAAHPGIGEWHRRTQTALAATRTITNKFGYRRVYFGRVDDAMLRKALAWVPQSTIALVASYVHMAMDALANDVTGLEVGLQMYDSVMGWFAADAEEVVLPHLKKATRVVIPYDDPLVIGMGIALSAESWGDCKEPAGDSWRAKVWRET